MKRSILNSVLILAVLFVSACKTKREIVVMPPVETGEVKKDHSKADALSLLAGKQFTFNTLALKAKANLDIDGESNDVTMNIRIKNGETIWVIVTAAGGIIEAARALITPDSIKIINKLKGEYIKKPFNYIQGFTNKQVNFQMLQSILTGNAIESFLIEKSDIKNENGVWAVSGNNQDLDYRMLFNTLLKVSETNLNDVKNAQALKVSYSNYQNVNSSLFPSNLSLNTMAKEKTITLNLSFTKVESNVPVVFPFTINKKLKLVD